MKQLIIFIFLLLAAIQLSAEKVTVLNDLEKPSRIFVIHGQLYVIDQTTVSIYSLKDYKLIKKFGKAGEGPQDFVHSVLKIAPFGEDLLISSLGRISVFSKNGEFKSSKKAVPGFGMQGMYSPLKDGFIGLNTAMENDEVFLCIESYDQDFKKRNTFIKSKTMTSKMKINVFKSAAIATFSVYQDIVFIADSEEFKITKFDYQGKELAVIKHETKKNKITDADKQSMLDVIKRNVPQGQWDMVKNMFEFPEFFPAIMISFVQDELIYTLTWEKQAGKTKLHVFDLNGKLKQELFIELLFQQGIETAPADIYQKCLYQLYDNAETEQWELHKTSLIN